MVNFDEVMQSDCVVSCLRLSMGHKEFFEMNFNMVYRCITFQNMHFR
jgi:hypothetical protein